MTRPTRVEIREATVLNLSAWISLRAALWPGETVAQHRLDAVRCLAGNSPFEDWGGLLAVDAREVVGFAEVSIRPWAEGCTTSRVGYLEGWYVEPQHRQRGVGTALIEAAEAWARARGCTEFASDADPENLLSFSAHLGVGFTDAGLVRAFRKDLPPAEDEASASPAELYRTERLVVRRLDADDLDAMLAVYSDPAAMRYVGGALDRSACQKWIDVTLQNYARYGYGMSAVTWRATEGLPTGEQPATDVIGFCGLVHPGGQAQAEVKYAYLAPYWGQGLATETLAGMLAYGAAAHGLREIIATAEPDNVASHRVLEKCGMRQGTPRRESDGTLTEVFTWRAPRTPTAPQPSRDPPS